LSLPASTRRLFLKVLAALPAAIACDVREYARARGAKLRLSIATGQVGGAYYVLGGGLAKVISEHVPNVQVTAELTAASVDNLKFLQAGQVDLGLALGPSLADAYQGTGTFREAGRVPVRTLAVLYTQPMHLVALARRGITRVADLRGRVVSTTNPGSGTEVIALRMLEAAGLDPDRDLTRERLGPAQSGDALKDGKVEAFFFSSGVPSPAVLELATTFGAELRLVSSDDVLPLLQQRYGAGQFSLSIIPARSYPGQETDVPTVGAATLLVVDEKMSETLAYEITRAIFDHTAELAAIHPVAKTFSAERAATGSPVPFHPGAIRYYRERGVWVA
jgi:TRAP transporter TAXI family solute receptor